MIANEAAIDGSSELRAAAHAGVEEVRYRNGVAVAWLRLVLRTVTLATWLVSGLRGGGEIYWSVIPANAVHLLVGFVVLVMLLRRVRIGAALLAAAMVDLLVVAVAGYRIDPGDGHSVANMMSVLELLVLLNAMCLPRLQAFALAAAATAFLAWMGISKGMVDAYVVSSVMTMAVFSVAAAFAGAQMVELATRRALESYTGQLERAHRDDLARANAEIAAQRDRLVASQRQAVTLTQLIVHDLRNPLACILQFVSLAEARVHVQGGLAEVEEDLRLAGQEGQRLANMVGDLLLVARLENGAMQARPQPVPVVTLMETAARSFEPRAADRRVAISVQGDRDLMAHLDLELVQRLLDNLIANALRYVRPEDRIELAAGVAGTELWIAVRNSGPPVPAEVRGRLFEKHAPGVDREWHNAGLGLHLCQLVAEVHGGRMVLVETPGWAVAFEARIPGALC